MSKMKLFLLPLLILFSNSAVSQAPLSNSFIKKNDTVNDTTFVNLKTYSNAFVYDMKYATADNFLKAKVYDCAECFLRLKTVKALLSANAIFATKGYKIKIYDCYRPLDIQKKMWEIVPNPKYVAHPKTGSIHNRGGAVDISLVTLQGDAVDMGTDFDYFGAKASHSYLDLPKKVLHNRNLLKSVMNSVGFSAFESEWWHYNMKAGLKNPISNVTWECE